MLPTNNEIRYLLLLLFSKNKTLTRKQAYEILLRTFNLTEKELSKPTRGLYKSSFKSTLEWQFTALSDMGFIKLGGRISKITKTGMNITILLKSQQSQKLKQTSRN